MGWNVGLTPAIVAIRWADEGRCGKDGGMRLEQDEVETI